MEPRRPHGESTAATDVKRAFDEDQQLGGHGSGASQPEAADELLQLPVLQSVVDAKAHAAAAARAAEAEAAGHLPGGIIEGSAQQLRVPAIKAPARLAPSKLAVYRMFEEQGVRFTAIAEQRRIQVSTAETYVAEAIVAGFAYTWHRIGVSDTLLEVIAGSAAEALRSPTSWVVEHCADTAPLPARPSFAAPHSAASHFAAPTTASRVGSFSAPCQSSFQQQPHPFPQHQQQHSKAPSVPVSGATAGYIASSFSAPGSSFEIRQSQLQRPYHLLQQHPQQLAHQLPGQQSKPPLPLPHASATDIADAAGVLASDSDEELTLSQLAQMEEAMQSAVLPHTAAASKPSFAIEQQISKHADTMPQPLCALAFMEQAAISAVEVSCEASKYAALPPPVERRAKSLSGPLNFSGALMPCGSGSGSCGGPANQQPQSATRLRVACTTAPLSDWSAVAAPPLSQSVASIAGASSTVVPAVAATRHLRDISAQLSSGGVTVKMLREGLPEVVDFGRLRLSLAHISRLVAAEEDETKPV